MSRLVSFLQDDLKELTKAYYTILKENEKLKRTH